MKKVWNERSICTDDQLVRIMPDDDQDCVIIQIHELSSGESECQLFLSYEEAKMLAKQISGFVDDNLTDTKNDVTK